jgi:hypothetical protein
MGRARSVRSNLFARSHHSGLSGIQLSKKAAGNPTSFSSQHNDIWLTHHAAITPWAAFPKPTQEGGRMTFKSVSRSVSKCVCAGLSSIALFQFAFGATLAAAAPPPPAPADARTVTPIKHVIVIIGENRSFDHVFATYKPKDGARQKPRFRKMFCPPRS